MDRTAEREQPCSPSHTDSLNNPESGWLEYVERLKKLKSISTDNGNSINTLRKNETDSGQWRGERNPRAHGELEKKEKDYTNLQLHLYSLAVDGVLILPAWDVQ